MGDRLIDGLVSIGLAIVGIATLAVIVSKNAQTGSVITAAASGFSKAIGAAVAPVSGGGYTGGGVGEISYQ
jgi:hypothetical protein